MKRFPIMMALALLAAGAAQAQTGAPLDLHPPVYVPRAAPVHRQMTPPVQVFDINPTAGKPQRAEGAPAAHHVVAKKHKKPIRQETGLREPAPKLTMPQPVHAKAAPRPPHAKPVQARAIDMKAPVHHVALVRPRISHPVQARAIDMKVPVDRVTMVNPRAGTPTGHRETIVSGARAPRGDEFQRSDALNDLSAHGYADFTNFRSVGGHYVATVTRDGRAVDVTAAPRTHQVTASP